MLKKILRWIEGEGSYAASFANKREPITRPPRKYPDTPERKSLSSQLYEPFITEKIKATFNDIPPEQQTGFLVPANFCEIVIQLHEDLYTIDDNDDF